MELKRRKTIRIPGYDYRTPGAYFVTICTKDRKKIFWSSDNYKCEEYLTEIGKIVNNEIKKISTIYETIVIDKYCIMPNHIHMIIFIYSQEEIEKSPSISQIVKQFKGSITKQVGFKVWDKSFHDHIIRDEKGYNKIWEYIELNPLKWSIDCYYV